ncbi:MAG TPA: hypothetical protein VM934_04740 [Pyrinomonadaceae bacterium]|nr:hypothetical protein [Pyrinomonadaceae bacterium]
MFKRALVIFTLILVTVAATLPFGESLASYGRRAVASRAGKAKAKRRSRAWWRRRRAQLRRQRALAASRRRQRAWALRRRGATARVYRPRRGNSARRAGLPAGAADLRTLLAPAKLPSVSMSSVESIPVIEEHAKSAPVVVAAPALAHAAPVAAPRPLVPAASPSPFLKSSPNAAPSPFASAPTAAGAASREARKFSSLPVPRTWQNVSSTLGGEFKFSLRGAEGRAVGTAVWTRLALAPSAPTDRRGKTLGGVSHAALRRTVIDRMVAEGGWVVNDFERELDGQRVFVVIAQSEGEGGVRRNWTYYFTETDGQLYSLATTAPTQFADAVAADAEGVVSSVATRARAAAAATAPKN